MKPPCKKDGIPCKKRRTGCQRTCPDMKKFLLFNALEMAERKKEQFKHDVTAESVMRMKKRKT